MNEDAADYEVNDTRALAAPDILIPEPLSKIKKHSPQANVDKFWRKFTTKHPGKVRSILPSDLYASSKARKSPRGVISGQYTGKSYEQAAAECKNAVIKIAKECRRVNAKYRDPHFDIEFDLKRDRRDCLDGLKARSENDDENDKHLPRSVKRVPDIFENPEFFLDEATASDVRQGFNGDCWFLSALCAITNKRNLIDGDWIQTIVDDKLYLIASDWWESSDQEKRTTRVVNREDAEEAYRKLNQTGSKALYFAQCRSENETWLPLLEKAYAKAHGDYTAIDGGFTGEAIEDLTGGVTQELFTTDILDKDKFWTDELMKVNDEFLFSCSTGTFDKWQGSDIASCTGARSGVIRMHAYSVMDAVEMKGKRLVKIRNPWARDEWRGAWSDGSEEWTAEWLQLLGHKFGDDGIFWISYQDLLQKYSSFDRTRLFGKEWQVVQQWTTIDVAWSPDYNDTKFNVTLTKQSPVVIVLSQLDDRYFKGLTGQYIFELQFRLDKNGTDVYIVRSHGNYSMRRSVCTDIELEAGTYAVLMKVTAIRYEGLPEPEAVIKDNVKYRQNKLIQIGLAYDLAHAKGEIQETEEEKKVRKQAEEKQKVTDKKKLRERIRAQKLKEWERGKRQRARDKRRVKRREQYAQKKAEKQESIKPPRNVVNGSGTDSTQVAAGLEAEVNKQAATTTNGTTPDLTSSGDTKKEGAELDQKTTSGIEEVKEINRSGSGSTDLKNVPEVVPNGDATITSAPLTLEPETNPPNSNGKTSTASPPDAPNNVLGFAPNGPPPPEADEDNDEEAYLYSSDASFVSSIDSILDFPDDDDDDRLIFSDPSDSSVNIGGSNASLLDAVDSSDLDSDSDPEFSHDPWNAVCVVGLRVYSKDPGCTIRVVRPKSGSRATGAGGNHGGDATEGHGSGGHGHAGHGEREGRGAESALDADDASKGISGEVEEAAVQSRKGTGVSVGSASANTHFEVKIGV